MAKKGVKKSRKGVQKSKRKGTPKKHREKTMQNKLSQAEQNILWCLHLGTLSISSISRSINLPADQVRDALENLEARGLVIRKNILGQHMLTSSGLSNLGSGSVKLDTKMQHSNIKDSQDTALWIFARNSGSVPLNNASVRIAVPQFVDVKRHNASYYSDGDKNIVEFPLTQLHPGETQSVNFRVKGFLTGGAVSSTYSIEVSAMAGEEETDKKELNLFVAK